jgi:hypothetical protein
VLPLRRLPRSTEVILFFGSAPIRKELYHKMLVVAYSFAGSALMGK